LGYFFHGEGYALAVTEKGVGLHFGRFFNILGDFLTNSSGHPESKQQRLNGNKN
jgi:hypothetical protein